MDVPERGAPMMKIGRGALSKTGVDFMRRDSA
jgi:hypothetical protein